MIRFMRILLIAFALGQLALGLLLWLAPGFFYDEIGPYLPRNDHYMADIATFYLALGAVALVAVAARELARPVLTLALVEYALRSLNHLIDIGESDPSWLGPANFASLLLTALLLGWMLRQRERGGVVRVFLAGASGAIGRPLVPKLIAAGHEVTGMTRSEARAGEIRADGAAAAVVDVFDADALRAAMTAASPEVVIHQLTALPERMDFRKKDLYTLTNRLRTEGTRNCWTAPARPGRAGSSRRASPSRTGTTARS